MLSHFHLLLNNKKSFISMYLRIICQLLTRLLNFTPFWTNSDLSKMSNATLLLFSLKAVIWHLHFHHCLQVAQFHKSTFHTIWQWLIKRMGEFDIIVGCNRNKNNFTSMPSIFLPQFKALWCSQSDSEEIILCYF